MDRLSNILKDRLAAQQTRGSDHPEADTLVAFAEQGLSMPARERVLAHLSVCSDCRRAVALAAPELELAAAHRFASSRTGARFPAAMRWASAAAALAVAVGVGVLSYEHSFEPQHGTMSAKQEVASTQPPPVSNDVDKVAAPTQKPLNSTATSPPATRGRQVQARNKDTKDTEVEARKIANGGVAGALVGGLQPSLPARTSNSQGASGPVAGDLRDQPARTGNRADHLESQYAYGAFSGAAAQSPAAVAKATAPASNAPDANAYGGAVRSNMIAKIADAAPVVAESKSQNVEVPLKNVASAAIGGSLKNRTSASTPIVHWTISSAGILQRQSANGSLAPVQPATGVIVSTVAAQGIEVWAGGIQSEISSFRPGMLFHSSDAGENWTQIKGPWQGSIKGLVLSQSSVLSVLADDGTWSTSDAGKSWAKK